MRIERLFSDDDLAAIREATTAAELQTGGEIVPYIVERVVERDEARWRGATLGALAAALIAGSVNVLGLFWGGSGVWWITLPAVAGAGLGFLVASVDAVGRRLIPDDHLERAVRMRAEAAFVEEEVFDTRDRTGILVFLSLFERRAVILADAGINRSVPEDTWQVVVDELVAGIRAGRAAAAMRQAVTHCGRILVEHEVVLRPDDTDELPDAPRIRER
jgi:putative membrane protein